MSSGRPHIRTDATGLIDEPSLRDRNHVFRDRADAGRRLAELLAKHALEEPLVVAIPAGGVPVAAALCQELGWPMEVAPVSKVTLPWNTEAGYGAVAFDGTVRLNQTLLPRLGLSDAQVEQGVADTRAKVERRVRAFRGDRPWPDMTGRTAVIVDDGLASGFTMRVALETLGKHGPRQLVVAVPTAHESAARNLAREVGTVFCANVRGGLSFAVADAYERWTDVGEDEALEAAR